MTTETSQESLDGMTLAQQIGQLFAVGFSGMSAPPELLDLFQRDFVGAVILFARNIRDRDQTAELTDRLQAAAREAGHPHPLLVMTDQENGLVRRLGPDSTLFPGNMALGAMDADDPERAEQSVYDVAHATARELLAHGITMNLAPVVDVNSNPANPVIGVRSFGGRAERVARLGAAALRGYQDAGVIATLKHFPGHGDTVVDSHRALPVVDADLERLEAVELLPFRRGVAAGAAAVMVAHVALPALTDGDAIPATLARPMVTVLLRERLGFRGIAVSDCLEMKAITRGVGTPQGAIAALRAGVDLALVSHHHEAQRASIAAVRAAVAAGDLRGERIREAAGRVLRLKARFLAGCWTAGPSLTPTERATHGVLSRGAYERSVTLVRDDAGLLPLRSSPDSEPVVVCCLSQTPTRVVETSRPGAALVAPLVEALRGSHARVRTVTLTPEATGEQIAAALEIAREASVVVLVTLNIHLDPRARQLARRVAGLGRPVVGIAVGNPYDAAALPEIPTYLATYEESPPALAAAAQVLLGAHPPRGWLPVTLETHAP